MGKNVRRVASLPRRHFLIVNPDQAVSTESVFKALGPNLWFMTRDDRKNVTQGMVRAINDRNLVRIAAALYNDLEMVVERAHPIVREIQQTLRALGAVGALMSGSGPTVFGLFQSRETSKVAANTIKSHYPSFLVQLA